MNPNLSSLTVKAAIIISISHCGPGTNPYPSIGAIPVPAGYHRITTDDHSFAAWLRILSLKSDRTVRLFDGSPKLNQDAQFAVLDVSVGHTDLQQCADAVMRLRAEYLYSLGQFDAIEFHTSQGVKLNFGEWAKGKRWKAASGRLIACAGRYGDDRSSFDEYLRTVFTYCGTLTLEKQLLPVPRSRDMRIGDVLIRGGSPGHAMLVVDMAVDGAGRRICMLAQSYMPAQDIHIVRNAGDGGLLSPWYRVDDAPVYTPEWTFYPGQLRTWPALK